ncbi:MAG: DUF4861 domain-containing protein [Bacteroidales bacterium]|nr:MAG: DUF4861 domain-containing protein [Bacteroidales bacterium]
MSKYNLLFWVLVTMIISCSPVEEKKLIIDNSEGPKRTDEPVVVDRSILSEILVDISSNHLPVFVSHTGDTIPAQFDDMNQDGEWDEIVLLCDLEEKSQTVVTIKSVVAEEYPVFKTRTNIRMGYSEIKDDQFTDVQAIQLDPDHIPQEEPRPYQFEGPGWENDMVAFRLYFDTRNGKDIFGKTTREMVLDNLITDYHELQDWGMDILKVGTSLGAGSLAIQISDSLIRLGNLKDVSFRIITEGPLRSTFDLIYKNWDVNGISLDLTERITIWAGKYWYQSEIFLAKGEGIWDIVAGIVNMQSEEVHQMTFEGFSSIYTFDNQSYIEDNLGLAIVVKNSDFNGTGEAGSDGEITDTYFIKLKTSIEKSSMFWFLAGWEQSDEKFVTKEGFENYMAREMENLSVKVNSRVSN